MGVALNSSPDQSSGRSNQPIRIAVIEDSAVIRGLIAKWLENESDFEVVGRFRNGKQAVENIRSVGAEVAVLDIEMPVMDGLTALPQLVKEVPGLKVIMASTLTQRNAAISFEALTLGASDYLTKPDNVRGVTTSESFREDLIAKARELGNAFRKKHPTPQATVPSQAPARPVQERRAPKDDSFTLRRLVKVRPEVLVIGASTGGPQAMFDLFPRLRGKINLPILITQHMPPMFTSILAQHLTKLSGIEAKEAEDGEKIEAGKIYIAPGDYHMLVRSNSGSHCIELSQGPEENYCRPAVDPMLRSVAESYGATALTIILTGMGHDGEKGAQAMVDAGGNVFAQDKETSVVWGMPGSVAKAGLCAEVLPLGTLGDRLSGILERSTT